jgi:hypothetical protein
MCKCIEQADKALAPRNTKLDLAYVFPSFTAYPQIATTKVDPKERGRAVTVTPSYCPFCGVKYPKRKEKR